MNQNQIAKDEINESVENIQFYLDVIRRAENNLNCTVYSRRERTYQAMEYIKTNLDNISQFANKVV